MFNLFLSHYFPNMADTKSEVEMTPLPTTDEIDGKHEDDPVIESQLARIKQFQSFLAQGFIWLRIIVVCGIALGIVFIVIHNIFAPNEKDVPAEVLKNLYKMLEAQSGVNIGSITQQWPTLTNSSSG